MREGGWHEDCSRENDEDEPSNFTQIEAVDNYEFLSCHTICR